MVSSSIPAALQQFIADTDPSKDFSKETLSQVQARNKRIRENYSLFFKFLISAGVPPGGTEGQVLTKNSNETLDIIWKDINIGISPFLSTNVYNETPQGVKDGVNKVFTTAFVYKPSTIRVYKQTMRLFLENDYIETGENEITLLCPFRDTDTLIVDYELLPTILT